jgi:hypothetical protein
MNLFIASVFVLPLTIAEAFPLRSGLDASLHHSEQTDSNISPTAWSRQDIFTFISVCVAVFGIVTAVLVAAPKVREWCCKPFECKLNSNPPTWDAVLMTPLAHPSLLCHPRSMFNFRDRLMFPFQDCAIRIRRRRMRQQDEARRRLQERYEDYVRFNQFLELMA